LANAASRSVVSSATPPKHARSRTDGSCGLVGHAILGIAMDRKQARDAYKQAIQPMGIVQVKNLKNGRCFIMGSANTRGTINSLRFQLNGGAFATSHELCRDWQEIGEKNFTIEVIDELKPVDDPAHDYKADLRALEDLWMEKLQPYDDTGYHSRKFKPKT